MVILCNKLWILKWDGQLLKWQHIHYFLHVVKSIYNFEMPGIMVLYGYDWGCIQDADNLWGHPNSQETFSGCKMDIFPQCKSTCMGVSWGGTDTSTPLDSWIKCGLITVAYEVLSVSRILKMHALLQRVRALVYKQYVHYYKKHMYYFLKHTYEHHFCNCAFSFTECLCILILLHFNE